MGMPNFDKKARAAKSCHDVRVKLANVACELEKAANDLKYTCLDMDWDEEPIFDIRDAQRCAGLALAKLVCWDAEDEEDGR